MKNFRLQIMAVVTATVLGILAALLNGGVLTPRIFGIAALAALVVCGSGWYRALKYSSQIDARIFERQSTTRREKGFYLRVASFLIILAFGAWATKGAPWPPRLIGITVLLLFFFAALRSRRRREHGIGK